MLPRARPRWFEDWTSATRAGAASSNTCGDTGSSAPIALGAEVFAERWTPIILRNLRMGCERFGDILAGSPGLPRSVLSQRLRRLEREGVIERTQAGRTPIYRLTGCGAELAEVCIALGVWGARWREVQPAHHDPYLVLWSLAHLVDLDAIPRPRIVVRFELTDRRHPARLWLLVGDGEREVCVHDPGFGEDAVITTDAATLVAWHSGRIALGHAERAGRMQVSGPRWMRRTLDAWGRLSPYAGVEPATR